MANFGKLLAERKTFMLSTYAILIAQLLVTYLILWKVRDYPGVQKFFCQRWMKFLSALLTLGIILVILMMSDTMPMPLQFLLLALFTLAVSFTTNCFTSKFDLKTLQIFFAATVALFVILSIAGLLFAAMGINLSFMGWILLAGLIGLLVAAITFYFVKPSKTIMKVFVIAGITIFSLLIAVETNMLLLNKDRDSPVSASLMFYVDFINLLKFLLLGEELF